MKAIEFSHQNSMAVIRYASMTMFEAELAHHWSTKSCNLQDSEHGYVSANEDNMQSDSAVLGVRGLNSLPCDMCV